MGNDRQRIRVYTDMVGDLFHWGHVAFLERARQLGSELWVGVHADDDVTEFVTGHHRRPGAEPDADLHGASPSATTARPTPASSTS